MRKHIPVLLQETTDSLSVSPGETVLDATVGLGGHAAELIARLKRGFFVGIDADKDALASAEKHLTPLKGEVKVCLMEDNFSNIAAIADKVGISAFDVILADLGWGSHHLESGRGFSFNRDEALDMCYSTRENGCLLGARDVVNGFEEGNLKEIIRWYGEEPWAARIARHIVQAREISKIATTRQLAEIVSKAVPKRFHPRKTHPATRTFQAVRITVNNEIERLKMFLSSVEKLVRRDSRLAIISFHSLEDRAVKRKFREWEQAHFGKSLTKRPVVPTEEEIQANRRSRSAKLRTFTFDLL